MLSNMFCVRPYVGCRIDTDLGSIGKNMTEKLVTVITQNKIAGRAEHSSCLCTAKGLNSGYVYM